MYETNMILNEARNLIKNGDVEQAIEIFLDNIDVSGLNGIDMENEAAFQVGLFLFEEHYYLESIEIWKELQKKGYRREEISQIVEEAFILPNLEEFKSSYQGNLQRFGAFIFTERIFDYSDLTHCFIPVAEEIYYVYEKNNRQIGNRVIARIEEYSDDEIFKGENAFDPIVFWKDWDYVEPLDVKQRNSRQMVYFLSGNGVPFSYLQLPEFEQLFGEDWHIFDSLDTIKIYFHKNRKVSLPRLYSGIQSDTEIFRSWVEKEHEFRCSEPGRDGSNILLTIGIPTYNRGDRALENIRSLQKLSYDTEIEFLVCDNCSQESTEGYQEIEKLAESDRRITYYRFPDNPGKNLSPAAAVIYSSGRFCCLLSDEDLIYLENIWKYLYLIQKYGSTVGFINARGKEYYQFNKSGIFIRGEEAFDKVFWKLNYLSGLIFKTDLYRKLDLYKWQNERRRDNYFVAYYAHNAAAMRCAIEEDVYICGELLFKEGEEDRFTVAYDDSSDEKILEYTRLDKRIAQMYGAVMLLNEWKDSLASKIMINSYRFTVGKVFFLIDLCRKQGKMIECSFQEAFAHIFREAIQGIEALDIEINDSEYAHSIVLFSSWYVDYFEKGAK